jgi:hypothetical protein
MMYLFLIAAPLILANLTGMVVAVLRWRRHPRVSVLALIGGGITLSVWVGEVTVLDTIRRLTDEWLVPYVPDPLQEAAPSLLLTVPLGIGTALLFWAAFTERERDTHNNGEPGT